MSKRKKSKLKNIPFGGQKQTKKPFVFLLFSSFRTKLDFPAASAVSNVLLYLYLNRSEDKQKIK